MVNVRGPATFRQRDVIRAIRAAQLTGLEVTGYEITREGNISVTVKNGSEPEKQPVKIERPGRD